MSDFKTKYGASGQAITCSIASLGNGSARQSTVIDNTANLYLDALVQLKIKSGGATSSTGSVAVYAYATADGGTSYAEGATGTDGAITLTAPTNLKLIGTINVVANATVYTSEPMSVAQAFGGVLPDHWGIVILNNSGGALDSTEGNHSKVYQGILAQAV